MIIIIIIFVFLIFQNVAVSITDIAWMDESKLLQESRVPHRVIQATASEGPAQDPYVATRVRFEPATLRTDGTEPYH